MLEKRLPLVSPQAFTSNGGTDGKVTVADASLFKVKQEVVLTANTLTNLTLEVKRVTDINTLYVGPKTGNIDSRQDVSAFTTALSAAIFANEQKRPNVPEQEVERLTYEEEPVVARRSVLVDKLGNKIDNVVDNNGVNRLAVDGQFHAEVDVQVDVDVDGFYDPVTNPDPDNIGLIGHTRSNPTNQTHQVQRQTAKRGTTDTDTVSADVSLHDHDGNQFTEANPLHVKESGPTRSVLVFGANPEHVTNIRQLIWDFSANYSFLTTAQNLSVSSDNVNDTLLGTGARTVRITGLDANYDEIEEVVNMNGTTPVLTTQQFLRRNRIVVETVGSAGFNIGNITIQGSSVQGYIASTNNRDRSVIYTVPNGYVGRLKQIFASVGPSRFAAGVKYGDLDIYVGELGAAPRITNISYLMSNGSQYVDVNFQRHREFVEKTDMLLVFTTEKEGAATQAFLEIFLEPN